MNAKIGWLFFTVIIMATSLDAQYFGRNKPVYQQFDFQVETSEHFEFYHYLKDPDKIRELALWTETWYDMHQKILRDTFYGKNPMVYYSNHPDFQQTNTISGNIPVGTGGVTEGFKNRVILPIALTNQQTHHVIGHELVHAFQYNMVLRGPNTSMRNLQNLPLWMVEGLAEYLSIGRNDPHTAMWMRDALIHDEVPDLQRMDRPQYFPYRWGQAFWAFLAGTYGDQVIEPFFMGTAMVGLQRATDSLLLIPLDSLSSLWKKSLKDHYAPFIRAGKDILPGGKLLSEDNSGRINIAPVMSPDSRHVIFLSERDVFSIDLFLANARTGEIIRKITSINRDGHLDDINNIESAGTWSYDGERFAFVAVNKGRNILVIKDVNTGRTLQEIEIPGVPAFSHPAWKPRSELIVVSGQVEGQTDLFEFDLKTKRVRQLTKDPYSEIHGAWSKDGSKLLFATDQRSFEKGRVHGKWTFNIAEMDAESNAVTVYDWFDGADNLNPQYDNEGQIYFLSNRDGYRNMYRYNPANDSLFQETDLMTGISGITPYTPALSVTQRSDRILYSYYHNGNYSVYYARSRELLSRPVDKKAVDKRAGTLPKPVAGSTDLVNTQINRLDMLEAGTGVSLEDKKLRSKFKLDYLGGGGGAGVGTGTVGTGVGLVGGVDALFSDILGNHQIYTGLALNGEIYDIGGVVQYINRKRRIAWGGLVSHIPYRSGRYLGLFPDQVQNQQGQLFEAFREDVELIRVFEERVGLFGQYPLSVIQRVELGGSFNYYTQRADLYSTYYRRFGNVVDYGRVLATERERLDDGGASFDFYNIYTAWVGDNSFFGVTSPLAGHRFRVSAEKYYSGYTFSSLTADYRRYIRVQPFTLAIRGMHIGRYPGYFELGKTSREVESIPLYVAQPWFIRGYSQLSSTELSSRYGIQVSQLLGSKMLIGGAEIRLPFTGPERLALISSRFLFTDINLFFDTGIAFREYGQLFESADDFNYPEAVFISSAGVSLRVNVFNAIVLEPYVAWPLRENTKAIFGLNFWPGW
jgi:hypothetical protein